MRAHRWLGAMACVVAAGCGSDPVGPGSGAHPDEMSGGATTIHNSTSLAFTFPAPNLADLSRHLDGDLAFDAAFVSAPAPTNAGLGPVFNNNACVACHVSNGRGLVPEAGRPLDSLLLRVSVPGEDDHGGPRPAPGLGVQLNDKAVFGVQPEARVEVHFEFVEGTFEDGEPYTLRRPVFTLLEPSVPLPPDLLVSPRVAPPVFGRGLLEAIDEATVLDLADEFDRDGDGVSGRPNYVWDVRAEGTRLGRFGWKANQPTLVQQAAAAYRNDMGVTNPLFPTESTLGQGQHDDAEDDPEIDLETVELAAFYTQTLGVPARRRVRDPRVRRGERIFEAAGCSACHVPTLRTGSLEEVPSVSNQVIHAYTDLLLHDMGEELADGRADFLATGREWRTAPLWGVGLTEVVTGRMSLLHDGRARSFLEAILWHGGEAESAREFVRRLPADQREELVAFLRSL